MERDKQDSIAEEAKTMEKLANKRSLMLKKVHCVHAQYMYMYVVYEPSISIILLLS